MERQGRKKEQRGPLEEDLKTMILGRRGKAVEWSKDKGCNKLDV